MVIHPKELSEETLYAIDQFVLRGGRLLAFVDPHCEEDRPPQDPTNPLAGMGQPRSSDLGPLLPTWGVRYAADRVAGDRARIRLRAQRDGSFVPVHPMRRAATELGVAT